MTLLRTSHGTVVRVPASSAIVGKRLGGAARRVFVYNCKEIVDVCLEFLDGSLPTEERRLFESHLGACPECLSFFETYRRTPELSREAFATQMPASVKEAVRSFLRNRCCR